MGRELGGWLALDWTPVLVAIITVVGTFLNTALLVWVYTRFRTESFGPPGQALENAAQTGHANNALLTLLAREHGIDVPEQEPKQ